MDAGKEISKKLIDWGDGMTMSYAFLTPVFMSKSGDEQRSALRAEPLRSFGFSFMEQTLEANKLYNRLVSLLNTEVLVPIYPEQFETSLTGSLNGISILPSGDIAYCYNLQKIRCGLYVYDRTGTVEPTIHDISSVTSAAVTLADTITDAIDASDAIFFPAVPCVLDDLRKVAITDALFRFDLKFKEKETWQIHS